MDTSGVVWIYHEKQFSSLCGQHCLNNLLQGAYFTAPDLADIARELDAREKEFMMQNGVDTEDALKYLAEDSGNVDDGGNFSIEVLRTALERSHGIKLISSDSEEIRRSEEDLLNEQAFICNRFEHWFAIRKINDKFWNLNSLSAKPEVVSNFYLSAFIAQLQQDGYSVFVVKGEALPPPIKSLSSSDAPDSWYTEADLLVKDGTASGQVAQATAPKEDYWGRFQNTGQRLGGAPSSNSSSTIGGGIASSSQASPSLYQSSTYDEDEALARAIAASMNES